jgi:hypothetical protein
MLTDSLYSHLQHRLAVQGSRPQDQRKMEAHLWPQLDNGNDIQTFHLQAKSNRYQ